MAETTPRIWHEPATHRKSEGNILLPLDEGYMVHVRVGWGAPGRVGQAFEAAYDQFLRRCLAEALEPGQAYFPIVVSDVKVPGAFLSESLGLFDERVNLPIIHAPVSYDPECIDFYMASLRHGKIIAAQARLFELGLAPYPILPA